jgi:class 3 adenylate cyclase
LRSGGGPKISTDRVGLSETGSGSIADRRLAAVAFVDIVGYTILMASDETRTHRRWMTILSEVISPQAEKYRGTLVKSTGDGVLVEFPSAHDAVEWAREVQRQVISKQVEHDGAAATITLRAAVHLGDVITTEFDVFGDGVNVAARLQEHGVPGGIILSEAVYDLVRGTIGPGARDLGYLWLRNFEKPIRAYSLDPEAHEPEAGLHDTIRNSQSPVGGRAVALRPNDVFKERTDCPEMVVVAGGHFLTGSKEGEGRPEEHPQHPVTIAWPFAVAKFELTPKTWSRCERITAGERWHSGQRDVYSGPNDQVTHIAWNDAAHVGWPSATPGKNCALLSEAVWQHAARAGCYDVEHKLWEWVADCYYDNCDGAPTDGSPWVERDELGHATWADCDRVARGGPPGSDPVRRLAARDELDRSSQTAMYGFRVARSLTSRPNAPRGQMVFTHLVQSIGVGIGISIGIMVGLFSLSVAFVMIGSRVLDPIKRITHLTRRAIRS